MANSDKNILITPNNNQSGKPKIDFVGAGNSTITLSVEDGTPGTLKFETNNRKIFEINSDISKSSEKFSVSDKNSTVLKVESNKNININKKVKVSNSLKLSPYQTHKRPVGSYDVDYNYPIPTKGKLVFDATNKTLSYANGTSWNHVSGTNLVTNNLFAHYDAFVRNSYQGVVDNHTGWRRPSSSFIRGTLLDADRVWSSEPSSGYSSVILGKTFDIAENFEVIAYWRRDYRGIGMVYGPSVSHFDFNGYSADGVGPYMGALSTSGFPNGYSASFVGQYHAPIQGQGNQTYGTYFRWRRFGNTLTIDYSNNSMYGSWSNMSTASCNSNDRVCVGAGEASSTEIVDLTLLSITSGFNTTWHDISGNGNDLSLINSPQWYNGEGFRFDPANTSWAEAYLRYNFANLGGGSAGSTGSSFTINVWFKINGVASNYLHSLVDICATGGSSCMILVGEGGSSASYGAPNVMQLAFNNRPIGGTNTSISGPVLQRHVWYNACVVRDTYDSTRLYLNGIEVGRYNGDMPTGTNNLLRVGRWSDGTMYSNASIPIVSLYERALTPDEVRQNFNAYRSRFGI